MLNGLLDAFTEFPDPRCIGRTRHRFIDTLVIAVCAVIAGAESWVDIADYGRAKVEWLGQFLKLPDGIPSHDTFRRIFSILDADAFERQFSQWVEGYYTPLDREVVAIDGKTIRRSFNRGTEQGPLHIVSAFATERGLSLGQLAVDGKSNEITAIPTLLDGLALKGNIVTIDAMGCQRTIAQQIINQQADYLLALKGNQKKRHRSVVDYCQATCLTPGTSIKPDVDAFDELHGRLVRRRGWVCPVNEALAVLHDWPGIRNIVLIERIRSVNGSDTTSTELRYYLSSCTDDPAVQIAAAQRHWAIENSLHWVLDVTFREDDSRIRDQVATRTFALLRKMALNIVRQDSSSKASLRGRRKSAGWNNDYMAHLLFGQRKVRP